MAASVLVRIERVLGKTNAFINAAALTENAEDAYQTFWNRMETPFQRVEGEDSDATSALPPHTRTSRVSARRCPP